MVIQSKRGLSHSHAFARTSNKTQKWNKHCITILMAVFCTGFIWGAAEVSGKGTPMKIKVESAPVVVTPYDEEKDVYYPELRGLLVVSVWYKDEDGQEVPSGWEVTIKFNDSQAHTKEAKADSIKSRIGAGDHLNTTIENGTTVKIELDDGSPFDKITKVEIKERGVVERTTKQEDDILLDPLFFRAIFDLKGIGTTSGAEALLQIGDTLPLVTTSTFGKTSKRIEWDLIAEFNESYYGTGYMAYSRAEGKIAINNVPLLEGFRAGTDDTTLHFTMSLGEPVAETMIQLTSFTAAGSDCYIEVKWTSATELDNAGFNIHRSTSKDEGYVQINKEFIPAMGSTTHGATYAFTDYDVIDGVTYYYWLEDVDLNGNSTMQGPITAKLTSEEEEKAPTVFSLAQNHPNPFNATTEIRYGLPLESEINLTIYNLMGQKVRTLVNEHQSAGYKIVNWDGKNEKGQEVSSGIYFCRIKAGDYSATKKMVFLK